MQPICPSSGPDEECWRLVDWCCWSCIGTTKAQRHEEKLFFSFVPLCLGWLIGVAGLALEPQRHKDTKKSFFSFVPLCLGWLIGVAGLALEPQRHKDTKKSFSFPLCLCAFVVQTQNRLNRRCFLSNVRSSFLSKGLKHQISATIQALRSLPVRSR